MNSTCASTSDIIVRGKAIYEGKLRAMLDTPENYGKILVIDVETADYEMGDHHFAAIERLRARYPDRISYSMRIGYPSLGQIGGGWGLTR